MAQKAPPITKGSFGERLRREREMRGVTLEEITIATRIGTRFLEALESERWDRLPGGVFNRGFVRAVARFLGLDEENLVAEYNLAINERPSATLWSEEPAVPKPARPWLSWLVGLGVIVVLGLGVWYGWHRYRTWRNVTSPSSGWATRVPTTPGASQVAPPAQARATGSGQSSVNAPAALQLRVEAVKTAALSVLADGQPVFENILAAGQSQTFHAREEFRLSTSNAGALLLELNGQTLPPLGPPGSPGKITLTRQSLKGAAGGNN